MKAPPVVVPAPPAAPPSPPALTQLRPPTIANLAELVPKPPETEATASQGTEIDVPPEWVAQAPEHAPVETNAARGAVPSGSNAVLFPQPHENADWAAHPGLNLSNQFSLQGGSPPASSGALLLARTGDEPTAALDLSSGMGMKVNDWTELRASAVTQMPGTDNQILELRLENIWRVTTDSTLSLGYQHLRSVFPDQVQQSLIKRDAMLIEYRIGF